MDVGEPDQYPTVVIRSADDELLISVAEGHWGTAEMRVVNSLLEVVDEEAANGGRPGRSPEHP